MAENTRTHEPRPNVDEVYQARIGLMADGACRLPHANAVSAADVIRRADNQTRKVANLKIIQHCFPREWEESWYSLTR